MAWRRGELWRSPVAAARGAAGGVEHSRQPDLALDPRGVGGAASAPGELLGQLARFLTAGAAIAVLSVLLYWLLAVALHVAPLAANFAAYALNTSLGFRTHRSWSFKGPAGGEPVDAAAARYFAVSLLALASNSLWTWALTTCLRLAAWTPVVPMVFLTPLATFMANRRWVFRTAGAGR